MAYRATRSIASGPDASTRSTAPAAASPPRSTARGFINITATARKADNPVGFKVARFHPAKPVFPVHFGDYTSADQVGDKAHDFG